MRKIKINASVEKLKDILKGNRRKHQEAFERALLGWQRKIDAAVNKYTGRAKTISRDQDISDTQRVLVTQEEAYKLSCAIGKLDRPQSHEREYDRVIGMLALHDGMTIEIDGDDYRHFVEDKWDWSHGFDVTNSRYA